MRYVKILLFLYLLLKPYYLFSSGALQLGDILLLLAASLIFAASVLNKRVRKDMQEVINSNGLLAVFVACTFIINGLYVLYLSDTKFMLSSLYLLFNLIAVVVFSYFFRDRNFLENISKILKFNLLVQLALLVLGVGKYYATERYMGTFNDPNQFGFYILVSFLFMYVLDVLVAKKKKFFIVYSVIAMILIVQSGSTGILLGALTFFCFSLAYYLYKARSAYSKIRKVMLLLIVGIFFLLPAGVATYSALVVQTGEQPVVLRRLDDKVSESEPQDSAGQSLLEDRGYDIIYNYPGYIFFGAGEGGYDRYPQSAKGYEVEIHATLPALLFYYGIIPFVILLRWIHAKIRRVDPRILIALIALLAESLTLVNHRQSLLWLIIAVSSAYAMGVYGKNIHKGRRVKKI